MNIDYLKWKVGYADGFEWDEGEGHNFITTPDGMKRTIIFWKDFSIWHEVHNPLLLHRAVIGINENENADWDIILHPEDIEIGCYSDGSKDITYEDVDDYETGIEQALKYIWEQEKK